MDGKRIQFHAWPWSSMGCFDETETVVNQNVKLQYRGSPILSVPQGFRVSTDVRHEDFLPLGGYWDGKYQLYRVPHAVAASKRANSDDGAMRIAVFHNGSREKIAVRSEGAVSGSLRDEGELQQAVREWMSFFDFCVQCAKKWERSSSTVSWKDVPECIRAYAQNQNVQKRSLIVSIAEKMSQPVQELVNSARRVLIHERRLLPAARASEMDPGCLHWYFRQPGVTTAQKASVNKQRLKALSRRETFNTLENRVFKDFLLRCIRECRQYVRVVCGGQASAGTAREVNKFGGICSELLKRPVWNDVDELESSVRPNYVLQSDTRYRRIWELYQKLLRKQDDEDWMWAWQGRTWADISTLLLGASLLVMAEKQGGDLRVSPLARAVCGFRREQLQGSRMEYGSEPGPFLLSYRGRQAVLEVVHAVQAKEHSLVRELGGTGGTLFFVLKPLEQQKNMSSAIVIWPVHTLSSTVDHDFKKIQASAEHGLKQQDRLINMRDSVVKLTGLVLADAFLEGEPDFEAGVKTHLACLAADPRLWEKNINVLIMLFEDLFQKLL